MHMKQKKVNYYNIVGYISIFIYLKFISEAVVIIQFCLVTSCVRCCVCILPHSSMTRIVNFFKKN